MVGLVGSLVSLCLGRTIAVDSMVGSMLCSRGRAFSLA
jgi:hypothetical protein